MPFNTTAKHVMLDALDESVTQITHVGIHTLTDPGTGTNANAGEATGGSPAYARQAVTWSAAASEQKTNSSTLTFDVPVGTYGFYTFWNASTGNTNNYRGHSPFRGAADVKGFAEVDSTGATNDTLASSGHGLTTDDYVMIFSVFAEAIPTGIVEGTIYRVLASGLTADVFKISTTSGGAAVNITGQGEVFFQRLTPEVFATQGQISVAASALILDMTAI